MRSLHTKIGYPLFFHSAYVGFYIIERIVISEIAVKTRVVAPEPEIVRNRPPFFKRFFDERILLIRKIIVKPVAEKRELYYKIFVRDDRFVYRHDFSFYLFYGRVFCVVVRKRHKLDGAFTLRRTIPVNPAYHGVAESDKNSASFINRREFFVVFVVEIVRSVFLRKAHDL